MQSDISCLYINTRSVKSCTYKVNKLREFNDLLSLSNFDITILTETWLTPSLDDSEVCPSNCMLHRKDRCLSSFDETWGGGVLMAIKSTFNSVKRVDLEPICEILVVEVIPNNHWKIVIFICYRPPPSDLIVSTDMLSTWVHCIFSDVYVIGDFNVPKIDWSDVCMLQSHVLLSLMEEFGQSQMNHLPSNAAGNVLDLVFTNSPETMSPICEL